MNPTNTSTLNSRITAAQAIPQLPGLKTMMNPPVMRTPTTSGAVLTSDTARQNVNAASDYLNNVNQNAAIQTPPVPGGTGSEKDAKKEAIYNTVSSIGADLTDAKVKSSKLKDLSSIEKAQKIYQANVKKIQGQLTQLQSNMDARTAAEIENIKQEYQYLAEEQEQANYQYESGVTTAGFRSGLARYSPQIQGNIMHNAMSEGVRKLSKLQQERAKLINEAESARDERNYKMLTTKMDMLRQNFKDQQDTVLRLREELRATDEATRKDIAFKTEAIAPQLSKLLTGNEEQDKMTIDAVSQQTGIAPSYLYQAVGKFQQSVRKEAPEALQEYLASVDLGYVNPKTMSYDQYVATRGAKGRGLPKGTLITVQEANSAGVPELAGISEDELAKAMVDSKGQILATAPSWFVTLVQNQTGQNVTQEVVQDAWNNFTKTPAVQKFVYAKKTGVTGVDYSALAQQLNEE